MFKHQTGLADAVGRTALELMPSVGKHWFEFYGQVALTQRSNRFTQGSEALGRWFDVYATPIGDPEERQVALFFNDISNRKRAEIALLQNGKRKDEFLATLAHELRNPLAPMRSTLEAMRRKGCPSAARRCPRPPAASGLTPVDSIQTSQPRQSAVQHVLVVNDNRDAADTLAEVLEIMGFRTDTAYDGLEGCEKAERLRPDVVVFDIGMPRLDGHQACRQLRSQAWGRDMLVLAVSGWGQKEDLKRSLDAGFDAHLVKPVCPAT